MALTGNKTELCSVAFDPPTGHLIAEGGGGLDSRERELIAWSLPEGKVAWRHLEAAKEVGIGDLTLRPGGKELACLNSTKGQLDFRSLRGKLLRTFKVNFLCGPVAFSPDGKRFVAPNENVLKVRDCTSGKTVVSIKLGKTYDSAEAAAFVPGQPQLLAAMHHINNKGHILGSLVLVDLDKAKVLKQTKVEFLGKQMVIDPQGRWAVIAGERRSRGWIAFWDLTRQKVVAEQGAHGGDISALVLSPDARWVATTGDDHEVRIWDAATGKSVHRLTDHTAEGSRGARLAWSADGQTIAVAFGEGEPPLSGIVVYQRAGDGWKLLHDVRDKTEGPASLRHAHYIVETKMDTVGIHDVLANEYPPKCPRCRLPDLDFVPQPYKLSRNLTAPGELFAASLGNLLVRDRARRILEVAAPGQCRFFPTVDAKTGKATDWTLVVPETKVQTAGLPAKYAKCPQCGEPKSVSHLPKLKFAAPAVEVFKSQQWTAGHIAEENEFIKKRVFGAAAKNIPAGQWTRTQLAREHWFSIRLLLLLKQLKVAGMYFRGALQNTKPTPEELAWIAAQVAAIEGKGSGKPGAKGTGKAKDSADGAADAAKWLRTWLKTHEAKKPLATREAVAAWEKKNRLKLPPAYADFVATVGRHTFQNMMGMETYSVRIVGPKQIDAQEYRRDPPEDGEEAEPDGVLFAVAINGDGLCFDVRSGDGRYPVYHFDHETEIFEPFAADFAQAIQRLDEQR